MRAFPMLVAVLGFGLAACGGGQEATPAEGSGEAAAATEEGAATEEATTEAAAATEEVKLVDVSAEGTKFEPPVQVAQIPDGDWYCDMGGVHFARSEEGDGKCGVCGMALSHKEGAAGEEGGDAHGDAQETKPE